MGTIRTHYLDASAIVMLLVKEQGSDQLHKYRRKYSNFYTTSLCFVEALSVLKVKYFYRKEITQEQYLSACDQLLAMVNPENIGIDVEDIDIKQRSAFREVENFVKKYYKGPKDYIDVVDAFQIYTLKEGFFSSLEGDSTPILITGDSRLAEAVRSEGLRVWYCKEDPPP